MGVIADAVGAALPHLLAAKALDSMFPLEVRVGLTDGAAALAFVVAGAFLAPRRHRVSVAGALYLAGACLAWIVLSSWWFPEHHPRAYQVSRVPLVMTLTGGLVGVLIIRTVNRRGGAGLKREPIETQSGSTPIAG